MRRGRRRGVAGVSEPKARWLVNERSGVVHDLRHLSERCNTDQIPRRFRRLTAALPSLAAEPGLRICHWCAWRPPDPADSCAT